MKLRSALLGATLLAAPVAATAQPVDGLYVGAGMGYNYLQSWKGKDDSGAGTPAAAANFSGKLKGSGGFIGDLSVGYGLGNGLRVEIEGDYRQDHQHLHKSQYEGGDSNTISYGGYLNALYDFDIGTPFFYPYVGVGAGYRWTELHGFSAYLPGDAGSGNGFVGNTQSKGGFSAQGMVGGAFPFPGLPGLSITAEYRFTGVFEKEKFDGTFTAPTEGSSGYRVKFEDQYNHSFLVGLRYAFNVAPPPPPPAPVVAPPAPAPARTYLVFFDWDRADLNARARQIVAEAAANSTKVQVTRIEVNGYTDTSGTPRYNLGLSIRRANSVKAELIKDGVPANEIDTHGYGDTHLLVQTGPGVREPQNRRVEIIFH